MLFDLSTDRGEVNNVATLHTEVHARLYQEMMRYFDKVGARIPKRNPAFDATVYKKSKEYAERVQWGAFAGRAIARQAA